MSTTVISPKEASKYDSAALRNTHQFITVQALNVLMNNFGEISKGDEKLKESLEILKANIEKLKEGSIAPDYGKVGIDRDYSLYQDHFFDPDTELNFTATSKWYLASQVPDNAESQGRNYFSRAIATWLDGDKQTAIYYLGKALHYFEDANEPHHASNVTGGSGTAHTRYEYYAEEVKGNYAINTVSDLSQYNQFEDCTAYQFISKMTFKHAHMAKDLKPISLLDNSWEQWNESIKIALGHAQEGVAIVLYRFLNEVTYPKKVDVTAPIGKFHAIIKVADEQYAGTNDLIRFGIEMKNGKQIEFNCDLPGDDFERGTTGCYQLNLQDATIDPKQIKSFYLAKWCTGMEDQVKVESVEVYMQGKRVAKSTLNKWLSSVLADRKRLYFPITLV